MTALKSCAAAAAALVALAGGVSVAAAQDVYYRPLTVAPHYAPRPHYVQPAPGYYAAPGYNPYAGPGAVVTAPVHFAGTLATLPFHALNTVFPAQGNSPLVVVGAPVYVAGKIVELPFRIAEAPFGGPDPFRY